MRLSILLTVDATKPGEDTNKLARELADRLTSDGGAKEFSVTDNTAFIVIEEETD